MEQGKPINNIVEGAIIPKHCLEELLLAPTANVPNLLADLDGGGRTVVVFDLIPPTAPSVLGGKDEGHQNLATTLSFELVQDELFRNSLHVIDDWRRNVGQPRRLSSSDEIKHMRVYSHGVRVVAVVALPEDRDGLFEDSLTFSDLMTEQARLYARQAVTDPLTKLENRRALEGYMADILLSHASQGHDAKRATDDHSYQAILSLDIDHFKQVNDGYGHLAGDAVLRQIGERIREQFSRSSDAHFRVGGEEMVVLFEASGRKDLVQSAERLRKAIDDRPFELPGGQQIKVTASIGAMILDSPATATFDNVLGLVDAAMYIAKNGEGGRNRVAWCDMVTGATHIVGPEAPLAPHMPRRRIAVGRDMGRSAERG